jgi:6-phosphogluconolactonase (cycloisomerase 2 family)
MYDTTNPVTLISGNIVTAVDGNVVLVKSSGEEFLWTENHWESLGLATSYALANHLHGNITNQGYISSDSVTIESNDRLLFSDNNNSGKIERSSITFDGSTTTSFLSKKGTWEAVPNASTS